VSPGRIDRKIEFPHPTLTSRLDILTIHSRKMNLMRGINLKAIAEKMPNASGAECKVRLNNQTFEPEYDDQAGLG
jgi:26S proteasome regulatory subunit T6